MHCFQCGEVLDHVDKMLFDMRYRGDLCWCHVPVIWCETVTLAPSAPGGGADQVGYPFPDGGGETVRHVIDFVPNGVWGHTCPHHKPGPRLRGRSGAGQGRYLILPCTSDTPLVRRS